MRQQITELKKVEAERKQVEERLQRLTQVLRAIRNVNQLITREKDQKKLLKGICETLTRTRGYYNAWLALLDDSRGLVATAEAGLGEDFLPIVERLRHGELTNCGRRALTQSEVVVVEDPLWTCQDCPLAKMYCGKGVMTTRLEYGGKVYGLMSLSVPRNVVTDAEEKSLFREVAGDTAFALHSMELDAERKGAEELSNILLQKAPIGIYIVQDGSFQYINPQFQESTGYSEDELLDTDPLSYVFPGDRDVVRARAVLMLKGKITYPYEYRVIDKAGKTRWFIEDVASIQYKRKRATLGSCMDITERKLLEKKMIEYKELNKLKSDLLSTVSHELRTPMATIKGYSTMILDYDRRLGEEEKKEYLQSIDRATDRLTGLVDHLLDMSRLDAGLLKLDKSPTSMFGLIKEAVAEGQLRTPKRRIVANVSRGLPRAMVDAGRIRQVLDNLLDNACKYSEEGKEVVVSARRVEQHLLISVTDQGLGIPADEVERVFDRMYRIEQRLAPTVGGMGLGLAICKGLVEAHGGRIWVESKERKGTRCLFTLPL